MTSDRAAAFTAQTRANGHDAIEVTGRDESANEIVLFDESQIKLADPVTRNSAGEIIPLSERFNQSDNRITFSLAPRSLASVADTVLAAKMGNPKFREALTKEARKRLEKIRLDGQWRVDSLGRASKREGMDTTVAGWQTRNKGSLEREAKVREGFEYDRLLRETFGADAVAKQEALPVVDRDAARSEAKTVANEWLKKELSKIPTAKEVQMMALRTLDAILSAYPSEIRGRVGGFVKLASLGTDKAREAEIIRRLDKLDVIVERGQEALRRQDEEAARAL